VSLSTPTTGATVSGAVVVRAEAKNCDVVRFTVDGVSIGNDDTAPYEITWNSGLVDNGSHTLKVRAEGGGGAAEDEITVDVQNQAGTVVVTVSPSTTTVVLGETQQFTATVTGSGNTGVTWSVDDGAPRGTISTGGLYTAPGSLPSPAMATVRATSQADASKNSTAVVTLTGGGGGGVTAEDRGAATLAFDAAHNAAEMGTDAVNTAAEAVWGASELNGWNLTLTGTLTQVSQGSEVWSYSAQPADRLMVVFSGGPTIEMVFSLFDGYLDGTWEDFADAHRLDFTAKIQGQFDIRVQSNRHYEDGAEVPYTWKSVWTRQVDGSVPFGGQAFMLSLTHTGTQQGYNEPGYAGLETEERYLGQASTTGQSLTLDEYYYATYLHNSNAGHVVRNWQMTVNSSVNTGSASYKYDTASARWESSSLISDPNAINYVREPSYWVVMGTFLKDGGTYGQVKFDGAVVADTNGPNLVLEFTGGERMFLHTLVPGPGE